MTGATRKTLHKTKIALLLIFLCMGLWGCPYDSLTPLGPVDEALIDPALPGIWLCSSEEDKNSWQFHFYAFDEKQYYVTAIAEGEAPVHFRAYTTIIKGKPFLNAQELEFAKPVAKRTFWFLRYFAGSDGSLVFKHLRDKDFGTDVQAVRSYIEKNIDSPDLYEDYCICKKSITKDKGKSIAEP